MATLGCLIRTLRSVTTRNGEEKGGEINCAWVKCRSGYCGGSDVGVDENCGSRDFYRRDDYSNTFDAFVFILDRLYVRVLFLLY